ncbi:ribulose-bisphosphate carboxylase large subunit family protein [Bosea rubneri]|uniref:Ribulose-bisphosphate carboxylase large subunit family protein n=1 Tax=Bosea rubneri TaxID=3075434 RepID=A0ABU3S2I3_9HYPH|nr:ribulose-bisphosphate carboxylase large subunit family protein [Bosea sp. ZW T0_25]MDU0338990.1 ribulose-bisphosphate carboxylase large subunit family protein [Bosea sp. ZW T0_25]
MSAADRFEASYLIETPLDPRKVAEVMAGEQSCGTFTRVAGETDALRERARAVVSHVAVLETADEPSLPNAWLDRKGVTGPWRRARVTISFPVDNVGANLATLASIVAGNLYDLGEVTGLRLDTITLPWSFRRRFALPAQGIAGTRRLAGVASGPLVGSIIKPNVGLSASETAELVAKLCAAGLDFIKDDEICANPVHAPLAERVPAVMAAVRRHQDRTGKAVMIAFNITDETDAMRRHADLVAREGGSCVMASLNWCGFSAIETLRRSTDLALHGHRNGYGAISRHPLLGISFQAYQTLWRLAGVDHMHVHGVQGKFAQEDEEVVSSARDCVTPLTDGADDRVMPAFSSGQWAGTAQPTFDAIGHADLLFMAGGGILAHPGGPAAGVASIRQAWEAVAGGVPVAEAAQRHPELKQALDFFGAAAG